MMNYVSFTRSSLFEIANSLYQYHNREKYGYNWYCTEHKLLVFKEKRLILEMKAIRTIHQPKKEFNFQVGTYSYLGYKLREYCLSGAFVSSPREEDLLEQGKDTYYAVQ